MVNMFRIAIGDLYLARISRWYPPEAAANLDLPGEYSALLSVIVYIKKFGY